MTSIGAYTKQIPLNSGYFRCIPSLGGSPAISSFMFNASGTTATGTVSSMVVNTTAGLADGNLSTSLFKDMGTQAVVNGSTFRRLQLVTATPTTEGVSGPNAGADTDYFAFYILTGFEGGGVPSPFIRA